MLPSPTYVTNTIAKEQTISKQTLTNSNAYTIELGEKLFKDLKLNRTTDDFGRPANEWFWKAAKVGTYADKADLSYTREGQSSHHLFSTSASARRFSLRTSPFMLTAIRALSRRISPRARIPKIGGQGTLTEANYDSRRQHCSHLPIKLLHRREVQKTVAATSFQGPLTSFIATR